ncbi:hypothetical protein MTO96_042526, partial [Rhipicephalus appendiculatus]
MLRLPRTGARYSCNGVVTDSRREDPKAEPPDPSTSLFAASSSAPDFFCSFIRLPPPTTAFDVAAS